MSELEGILADGPPVLQLDETNSRRYRRAATVFAHASRDPVTVMKDTGKSRGPSPCVVVASPTRAPPTLKRRGSRTTTTSLSESESDELLAYYSSFTELTACDSDAFSRAYEPAGTPHQHEYRRRGRVRARCMEEPFAVATRVGGVRGAEGDVKTPSSFEDASLTIEHGEAGDYLVQNDAGDQWVTDARSMAVAYCVAPEDDAMEEEEVDEEETTTTTTTAATTPREGNTSQHETPRGGTTAAAFALLTPAVPPLGYASTHRTTSPATLHVNRLSGGGLLSPTVSLAPSPTSSTLTGGGFFASSRTGTTTSTPVASAPPTPRKKTNAVASATTTTTTTTTPILKKCAVTRDTAAVADRPTITRAGIVTRAQEEDEE